VEVTYDSHYGEYCAAAVVRWARASGFLFPGQPPSDFSRCELQAQAGRTGLVTLHFHARRDSYQANHRAVSPLVRAGVHENSTLAMVYKAACTPHPHFQYRFCSNAPLLKLNSPLLPSTASAARSCRQLCVAITASVERRCYLPYSAHVHGPSAAKCRALVLRSAPPPTPMAALLHITTGMS
jgi:hypothetical protein